MTSKSATSRGPLDGIRVVEVAQWIMVPGAAALLADWGADVIKVEPPGGDPLREFGGRGDASKLDMAKVHFEQLNRGKRSVVADLATTAGRQILRGLLVNADVFMTSTLPPARRELGITAPEVREKNAALIYATSSAAGRSGPDAEQPGYDYSTFWARSGLAHAFHHDDLDYPVAASGGLGDLTSSMMLAAATSAAIAERARTGEAVDVDVSLLGTGMWLTCMDILAAIHQVRQARVAVQPHAAPFDALVNFYRTSDGRFIALTVPNSRKSWPELCERIGRADLLTDERFSTERSRRQNRRELVEILDVAFGAEAVDAWRDRLDGAPFVWAVASTPSEVDSDPQVVANSMLMPVDPAGDAGYPFPRLVSNPADFGRPPRIRRRAPQLGEHNRDSGWVPRESSTETTS